MKNEECGCVKTKSNCYLVIFRHGLRGKTQSKKNNRHP